MKTNRLIIDACLSIIFLAACTPSPSIIQTAIAQTRAANPTSTLTPVLPTETPTKTPTIPPTEMNTLSPSPTIDLILLQSNLKDFLLQKSDLPQDANYIKYVQKYNSLEMIPNLGFKFDYFFHGLDENELLSGWRVEYGIYYPTGGTSEFVDDYLFLFQTSDAAQLAIAKYSGSDSGSKEEINPPEMGDHTRSFYIDLGTQGSYAIVYSYRNIVHVLNGFGMASEVVEFVRKIARNQITRLQTSSLVNP